MLATQMDDKFSPVIISTYILYPLFQQVDALCVCKWVQVRVLQSLEFLGCSLRSRYYRTYEHQICPQMVLDYSNFISESSMILLLHFFWFVLCYLANF